MERNTEREERWREIQKEKRGREKEGWKERRGEGRINFV